MNEEEVHCVIDEILARLPPLYRSRLDNVAFVIRKKASRSHLQRIGLDPDRTTLYGLYEGTPLPRRSSINPPLLPDKITIFFESLKRDFPDPEELRHQLRITLLHEIAHYFGMNEKEIEKLGY